jgi:hypothetical protein
MAQKFLSHGLKKKIQTATLYPTNITLMTVHQSTKYWYLLLDRNIWCYVPHNMSCISPRSWNGILHYFHLRFVENGPQNTPDIL